MMKENDEILKKMDAIIALLKKDSDDVMNLNQVADYLSVKPSKIYEYVSNNLIKSYKPLGKKRYFFKNDIDEFIKSLEGDNLI